MKEENKMRDLRIKRNLRFVDLSKKTGYSIGWLWALEQGLRNGVSLDCKEKVAEALGSTIRELFGKE